MIAKYVVKKMPTKKPAIAARCRYFPTSLPVISCLLSSTSNTVLMNRRPGKSG